MGVACNEISSSPSFFGQVFKSGHCCNGILLHTRILFAQAKHVSGIFINENAKGFIRQDTEY